MVPMLKEDASRQDGVSAEGGWLLSIRYGNRQRVHCKQVFHWCMRHVPRLQRILTR